MAKSSVSCRVLNPVKRELVRRAELAGVSLSAYVEQQLTELVSGDESKLMRIEMMAMSSEIKGARADFAKGFRAMLIASGFEPEQADKTVEALNLKTG